MSKSNSIITDIDRLLVYCDYKFHTRKISVLECLDSLEVDARQSCLSKEQFLEQVLADKVVAKVTAKAVAKVAADAAPKAVV